MLNTRLYEVTFLNGNVRNYTANKITEAIFAEVDEEGNKYLLLDDIIDHHCKADAINTSDMWTTSYNGNKQLQRTTKGWDLCILWKDGSTSWETLSNLKASHPLQTAEYAIYKRLVNEPAFK